MFRKKYNSYTPSLLEKTRRYDSLNDLEANLETSQFNIDLQGFHFECLFHARAGNHLYVIYNGARYKELPEFPRWTYHDLFEGSMLCIEDPLYYIYPKLTLGWFYGTKDVSLIALSIEIIKAVCRHERINENKVIFFSSSGGGYAGIYAASLLHGTLAIALNPQLYIQHYIHTPNFVENTGIDLSAHDPLQRNDIPARIKKSKSRYVILFNAQCNRDWHSQAEKFAQDLGVRPAYGIIEKDNVLLWIYDCAGVPDPHTSFETKNIFCFIDDLAKQFYQGALTEHSKQMALIINECWHDIYDFKYKIQKASKKHYRQEFMFLGNYPLCDARGGFQCIEQKRNIVLEKKKTNFHFFQYKILTETHRQYFIKISNVQADFLEYTAGIFDFENNVILHYEACKVDEPHYFNFVVGKHVKNVALCIYAGIMRHTYDKSMIVGELSIMVKPLSTWSQWGGYGTKYGYYRLEMEQSTKLYHAYCKQRGSQNYFQVYKDRFNSLIFDEQESHALIAEHIHSGSAFSMVRPGNTEINIIGEYIEFCQGARMGYSQDWMNWLLSTSGFFLCGADSIEDEIAQFAQMQLRAIEECDIFAIWGGAKYIDYVARNHLGPGVKCFPFWHCNTFQPWQPWTRALKGKTVLIVSPFTESIKKQYSRKEKLSRWEISELPEFDLKTYPMIQTQCGNTMGFASWFSAYESVLEGILSIDFDIAIIGAGAYGLPLCADLKRHGKQALNLCSYTPLIFGVAGKRFHDNGMVDRLGTPYWIRPVETPPAYYKKIENGCYW